jgi:hypothetical protein
MKIKLQWHLLWRNEIKACRHILCSGSIPPKIHKKKLWKFLQVKSMADWDSAKELAMYTVAFRVLISVGSKIPSYYSKARKNFKVSKRTPNYCSKWQTDPYINNYDGFTGGWLPNAIIFFFLWVLPSFSLLSSTHPHF